MIPQESYASSPNGGEYLHSEDIPQAIQELRLTLKPEIANLRQEHDHLRQRVNTVTGLLLGAGLLIIGSLAWMGYQIQSQAKLLQQSDPVSASTEVLERLTSVEQQLQTLSEQTPEDLLSQVQDNQTQLEAIAKQLSLVEANAENLQNLTEAIRQLTGRQIEIVTPAQPSPVQSTPAPSDIDSSEEEVAP
ncbi:MAG: hypothetical protein QNJ46_16630 [Leptolyngbyaceae cyanobacterium MO_188.B28]|nr:hypothetical protein [Leptolyngbyaceae cyanobacterium MO_188.B28]